MYTAADMSTNVMLSWYADLVLESAAPESAWSLRMKASGTVKAPRIGWTLTSKDLKITKTKTLDGNGPVTIDLASFVDSQGRFPTLTLSRMPADGIIPLKQDRMRSRTPPTVVLDDDGAFRQVEPVLLVGEVKDDGDATLLLHLDAEGRVSNVDIEEVKPAGALGDIDARDLVIRDVYTPQRINGKAVPSKMRMQIRFWRETPPLEEMYPQLAKAK